MVLGGGFLAYSFYKDRKKKSEKPDLSVKDVVKQIGEDDFVVNDDIVTTVKTPLMTKSEKELLELYDIQT